MDRPQIILVKFYTDVMINHLRSLKQCFFCMRWKIYPHAHHTRSFARSTNGATLVEFALTVPLFLLFLMALMDFGLMMTKWVLTDNALNKVSRASTVNTATAIQNEIEQETIGLVQFDGDKTCLIVKSFDTLAEVNAESRASDCGSILINQGTSGQFSLYEVVFTHEFLTPIGGLLSLFGATDFPDSITFTTSTILRNE